ncbi:MAG TPA: hypothetical protein VLL98_00150 [Rickettsiales bacterium]|nr:hypothetical protein [Rickettsiales bacterium]
MIFTDLIQNFYFKIVKDKIATFIANERDNQLQIARDKGYTEAKIKSDLDFTIFTDKFKPLTKEDLPCVIIDIANTTYPANMQYCNKVYANSVLQFYLFSKGYSQQNTDIETNKSTIISDDKISSIRLDYLLSQILAICNAEQSYCFGTESNKNMNKSLYIDKKILSSWKRILTPEDNNQTETTLAYLLEYNISYFEYTEQIKGDELKELYTKLEIRDEFIDPFIKLTIDNE